MKTQSILLEGLDGSNPLAFLAALGAFRALTLASPNETLRMAWEQSNGAWRPRLSGVGPLSAESVISQLVESLLKGDADAREELHLGKNLTLPPDVLRSAAQSGQAQALEGNRRLADFVSSFGCEVFGREVLGTLRVSTTEFYFVFGSGHQHFLETASKLLQQTKPNQLKEAVFGPWQYRDNKLSFRWDPADAREHAYQWISPGDEAAVTVWGANVLAFEAIPLFPVMPDKNAAFTTAFARGRNGAVFRWPIWSVPLTLDVARSLISLDPDADVFSLVSTLTHKGVVAVFESRKRKIGEGANFKWAFTPARAI